jgi:hypothetical protein
MKGCVKGLNDGYISDLFDLIVIRLDLIDDACDFDTAQEYLDLSGAYTSWMERS